MSWATRRSAGPASPLVTQLTMVATVARFCVRRRLRVLAACALLAVAGIVAAGAVGPLGHPAAALSANLDAWAALRKLLALVPHW